jgi:Flp pilus assembly protein TadG
MALAKKTFRNRSGRRSESGTAAIEFAMFLPLLVIMITGTAELGHAMYEAMQVNNAAEAGILYAAKNSPYNSANIQTAALNGSTLGGAALTGMTATPSLFCGCPAANTVTNLGAPPCSLVACAGSPAGTYVQVATALPHVTILDLNALLGALTGGSAVIPATFTATAIVRTN